MKYHYNENLATGDKRYSYQTTACGKYLPGFHQTDNPNLEVITCGNCQAVLVAATLKTPESWGE